MNKYHIVHETGYGNENYFFISEKSLDELQLFVGLWGEQDPDEDEDFNKLCKLLDIDFEPHNEFLTIEIYDIPTFVDLTGKL